MGLPPGLSGETVWEQSDLLFEKLVPSPVPWLAEPSGTSPHNGCLLGNQDPTCLCLWPVKLQENTARPNSQLPTEKAGLAAGGRGVMVSAEYV